MSLRQEKDKSLLPPVSVGGRKQSMGNIKERQSMQIKLKEYDSISDVQKYGILLNKEAKLKRPKRFESKLLS